jgi:26S proteasome regulatory subunit N2
MYILTCNNIHLVILYSKVYYHLGAFEDSLTYALGAGDLFDVNGHSEYVDTTIGKNTQISVLRKEVCFHIIECYTYVG